MSNNPQKRSWFERFMRWTQSETAVVEHEVAEDPERTEFMEYLEYLDSHEHIDFGAYRLMRYQKREAKHLPGATHQQHDVQVERAQPEQIKHEQQYHPGHLRLFVRIYAVLSVLVAGVMMVALLTAVMSMPRFGDPDAPTMNQVPQRYLEQGIQETGAVNAVAGMILDYRAFDTFGESTVLFAAAMSTIVLLRRKKPGAPDEVGTHDGIFPQMGKLMLPAVMMFGIYIVLNGHLGPGGGFSGGTVLGCGLILAALVLGRERMEQLLPSTHVILITVTCLLAYGVMKGYSFVTGANHIGWDIPKGIPGAIFSAGLILPLNICVGLTVACTMYTFFILFSGRER